MSSGEKAPSSPSTPADSNAEKPYDPEDEFRSMFMSKEEFEAQQRSKGENTNPTSSTTPATATSPSSPIPSTATEITDDGHCSATLLNGKLKGLEAVDASGATVNVASNPSLQSLFQKALQQAAHSHAHPTNGSGEADSVSEGSKTVEGEDDGKKKDEEPVVEFVTPGAASLERKVDGTGVTTTTTVNESISITTSADGSTTTTTVTATTTTTPTTDAAPLSSASSSSVPYLGPDKAYRNMSDPAYDPVTKKNSRKIICPFCKKSVIFLAGAADYVEKDIFLPYANAKSKEEGQVYTEHFKVSSQMAFENIGVRQYVSYYSFSPLPFFSSSPLPFIHLSYSIQVSPILYIPYIITLSFPCSLFFLIRSKEGDPWRYLTCCDCDKGPLGITYHEDRGKIFYIAHRRVRYQ